MSELIPFGLLNYTPLVGIGDTQIIYTSGKIWNYGITICEADEPLILTLPNNDIGSTKKIFSNVITKIKFESGEIDLEPNNNFSELIFTHIGWTTLNNDQKIVKSTYYESKESLSGYKIFGNHMYIILSNNNNRILIFKAGKLIKSLEIENIKKINISNDWLFILTNKLQYFDITFNKFSTIDLKVDDFITQNFKFQLILEIDGAKSFYQYENFKWEFKLKVGNDNSNIFNITDTPTLVYFQDNKLIEHPTIGEIKSLELTSNKNLGIWQFSDTIIILSILSSQLICNINFNRKIVLDTEITTEQVNILSYNNKFLVLLFNGDLKLFIVNVEGKALCLSLNAIYYFLYSQFYDLTHYIFFVLPYLNN